MQSDRYFDSRHKGKEMKTRWWHDKKVTPRPLANNNNNDKNNNAGSPQTTCGQRLVKLKGEGGQADVYLYCRRRQERVER